MSMGYCIEETWSPLGTNHHWPKQRTKPGKSHTTSTSISDGKVSWCQCSPPPTDPMSSPQPQPQTTSTSTSHDTGQSPEAWIPPCASPVNLRPINVCLRGHIRNISAWLTPEHEARGDEITITPLLLIRMSKECSQLYQFNNRVW